MKRDEGKAKKALNEFLKECKKRFGKNLQSVVFFGSRVKGLAKEDSDFDILMIIDKLPDIKQRFDLVSDIETRIFEKYKIKISTLLFEPEEIFEPINPLLFGVLTGYKVLFGMEKFKKNLEKAKVWIKKINPIYIEGERKWRIKELI
ncbi:MAG: nucleotidyltransferase domain-containing protein [Candidatus Aenigmatarchaeota archaeon]